MFLLRGLFNFKNKFGIVSYKVFICVKYYIMANKNDRYTVQINHTSFELLKEYKGKTGIPIYLILEKLISSKFKVKK